MTSPLPLTAPQLELSGLTSARERRYFPWVVAVAVLVWLGIAISMVGIFYGAIFGVFLWLGHGLLAAHLRAEGVKVSERQLPGLAATFRSVCEQLGLREPPALYVIQQGGALNAFALRHAGRDFVVVFSDLLDALGPDSPEMRFLLGHEIGHLRSRHPLKQVLLAPGLFFPLLGPAYRRAWETSCDRFGAFAAQDTAAAVRAMLTLSGGVKHGPALDGSAFADQHLEERGFFVSLHELTSTYPTSSRRVTDLIALATDAHPRAPRRHPLAYLLALVMPGGSAGGGAPAAMMMIVLIGLMAAMAIPAFQKVRASSQAKVCHNNRLMLEAALDQYVLENQQSPKSFDDVVGPGNYVPTMPRCLNGGVYSARYADDHFVAVCSVHGEGASTLPGHRGD